MKSITINGSKRESVGKKATKALRNAGQVPCVLYGGDQASAFFCRRKSVLKTWCTLQMRIHCNYVIALDNGQKICMLYCKISNFTL